MDKIVIVNNTPPSEREWLERNYPMTPDNPCLNMTDEQFLAYIREKREAFDYDAARARDRAQRDAYFKERSVEDKA